MRWIALILLVSSCHCRQPKRGYEPSVLEEQTQDASPTLTQYFSSHDDRDCPSANRWGEGLAEQMVQIAQTVQMPPWVGIRAATCVTQAYGDQQKEALARWVSERQWAGLGRAVILELSQVEEALALQLVEMALVGHLEEFAIRHLEQSVHEKVRTRIIQHRTR